MHRLPGLDFLRAAAIVWVMLFHSWLVGGLGPRFAGLQNTGWMAVDLFFVLSGYLLGGQLLRSLARDGSLDFASFYWRRSLRIIPAYTAVLALYFLVPGFNREGSLPPVWEFLTYTVNLFIGYDTQKAFSNAWSLCVEEHFYVFFPLIAWLLARWNSRTAVMTLVALVLGGGMLLRWSLWRHSQGHFLEVIYYPTYNRLDGLLAGVALAAMETYQPRTWAWLCRHANRLFMPLGIVLLGLASCVCADKTSLLASVTGYPLIAAAMASLVIAGASPTGMLAHCCLPGIRWIALVSYSLYLIHKAIFKQVEAYLPAWFERHAYLTFLAYATATLAAGALLYYLVEKPFLRLRDRDRRLKTPRAPAQAAQAGTSASGAP